eukprot:CAMPEP_0170757394 /NCGR_PEP_ID=MMETSP0437-20130122/14508_1 /TAXON_ID=0 /ORGANISM="Sexangularia sp." /LENGTH=455 /DNA_ID=CAMNT_0011096587 /DNA_START=158 /DNA_END=1523 /DNA_ORIENTATION=+
MLDAMETPPPPTAPDSRRRTSPSPPTLTPTPTPTSSASSSPSLLRRPFSLASAVQSCGSRALRTVRAVVSSVRRFDRRTELYLTDSSYPGGITLTVWKESQACQVDRDNLYIEVTMVQCKAHRQTGLPELTTTDDSTIRVLPADTLSQDQAAAPPPATGAAPTPATVVLTKRRRDDEYSQSCQPATAGPPEVASSARTTAVNSCSIEAAIAARGTRSLNTVRGYVEGISRFNGRAELRLTDASYPDGITATVWRESMIRDIDRDGVYIEATRMQCKLHRQTGLPELSTTDNSSIRIVPEPPLASSTAADPTGVPARAVPAPPTATVTAAPQPPPAQAISATPGDATWTPLASVASMPIGRAVSVRVQVVRVRRVDPSSRAKILDVSDGTVGGPVVVAKTSDTILSALGSSDPPLHKWLHFVNFRVTDYEGTPAIIGVNTLSSIRFAPQEGLELDD